MHSHPRSHLPLVWYTARCVHLPLLPSFAFRVPGSGFQLREAIGGRWGFQLSDFGQNAQATWHAHSLPRSRSFGTPLVWHTARLIHRSFGTPAFLYSFAFLIPGSGFRVQGVGLRVSDSGGNSWSLGVESFGVRVRRALGGR